MKPTCTPAEIDEAAVWIARLHAPDRTLQVERGFRRWLAEKASHAEAFETVSTGWELTGMLERKPFPRMSRWQRAGFRAGFMRACAAVATMAIVVGALLLFQFQGAGVETGIGEQRVVILDDGTRVTLNTDTRILTRYDEHARTVELRSGEAMFEVAKKGPAWPFVVLAGDRSITALGTSFVVRNDAAGTSVVLVEGKVAVAPVAQHPQAPSVHETTQVMSPGQRLTFTGDRVSVDEPPIQKVTAWRWGQVELEDTPLQDAVEEMNRYSTTKIFVATPQAQQIRVNGIFRTGDTTNFATALAQAYGLTVVSTPQGIVLEGVPATSSVSTR